MANKPASWKRMVRYNKHDVALLAGVYDRLKPWMHNHPHLGRITNPNSKQLSICPNCAKDGSQRRGVSVARQGVQQRWQCRNAQCGHWYTTRREASK